MAGLRSLLQTSTEGMNIVEIVNDKQHTVLAQAAYKNSEEAFMFLYTHALNKNVSKNVTFSERRQIAQTWINRPTEEEFTALHFTVYHGNFTLLKFLMKNGADHQKANKFGSTVMHVAAQGDQPLPFYYFLKEMKMDINMKDKR